MANTTILNIQKFISRVYLPELITTTMENQYCKVGTITPIAANRNMIHLLEYQYQNFLNKASDINDDQLVEFFELKASKIKRVLENLV